MLLFLLLLFSLSGNFAEANFSLALEQTRNAFAAYAKNESTLAYELLSDAYTASHDDNLLNATIVRLASKMYIENQATLFKDSPFVDYVLGINRSLSASGNVLFSFYLNAKIKIEAAPLEAHVSLPSGKRLSIFSHEGANNFSKYPSKDKGFIIIIAQSDKIEQTLPPGIYTFSITNKLHTTQSIPIFLFPDNNPASFPRFEFSKDSKKLNWSISNSALAVAGVRLSSALYQYGISGTLPLESHALVGLERMEDDTWTKSGSKSELSIKDKTRRCVLYAWESLVKDPVGVLYGHEIEQPCPKP